jgi:hypothetical protein
VKRKVTLPELRNLVSRRCMARTRIEGLLQSNQVMSALPLIKLLHEVEDVNLLDSTEISNLILAETGRYVGGRKIVTAISSGYVKMHTPWSVQLWMLAVRAECLCKRHKLEELLKEEFEL